MTLNEAIACVERWSHEDVIYMGLDEIHAVETLLAFARKRRTSIVKALPCPKCWCKRVSSDVGCGGPRYSAVVICQQCDYEVEGPWVDGKRAAINAARELWNAEPREVTCEPE